MTTYGTESIANTTLRVTFYARVSTDSKEQLNSLGNQLDYYKNYISQNPNWTYVDGYYDEGISGAFAEKREGFQQMVADAEAGKFDLILTKEISRFARNTVDALVYTRQLKDYGVGVFFQSDNLHTFGTDGELRLSIMSTLAQDELRKLSERVKFGHQQAIKKGVVLGNSRIFGYKKDKKKLIIDEYEAEMVRLAFEMYATDRYSMREIENHLYEKGYRNHNGNKISHTTISNMISNPKYKGYYVGNKIRNGDIFSKSKKRHILPQEDWVMYKDETGKIVPAIVSEELWDRANEVLSRRSLDVKQKQNKCNHDNLLTGKLYCSHCGTPYYRKDAYYKEKNTSRWVCSGKLKNGSDSCSSFPINETEIKKILFDVFSGSLENSEKYINEYLEIYKNTHSKKKSEKELSQLEQEIKNKKAARRKLIELNVAGHIDDDELIEEREKYNQELQQLYDRVQEIEEENDSLEKIKESMKSLKKLLDNAVKNIDSELQITKEFINRYIDSIEVTPQEDGSLLLNIKLFSNEIVQKSLVRTGHTFKKMIESYEKNMK